MLNLYFSYATIAVLLCLLFGQATANPLECKTIENNKKRLACYDTYFSDKDEENIRSLVTDVAEPSLIEATIKEVDQRNRKKAIIYLENGQVWTQTSLRYIRIKAGDQVTLSRGTFGAYVLESNKGASSRVRRLN